MITIMVKDEHSDGQWTMSYDGQTVLFQLMSLAWVEAINTKDCLPSMFLDLAWLVSDPTLIGI